MSCPVPNKLLTLYGGYRFGCGAIEASEYQTCGHGFAQLRDDVSVQHDTRTQIPAASEASFRRLSRYKFPPNLS